MKLKKIFSIILSLLLFFNASCGGTVPGGNNDHIHTFANEYTHNDTHHWYEATCGHNEKENYETHTFDDRIVTKEATATSSGEVMYTCLICGYEKIEEVTVHIHTFSDKYSYDEYYHWNNATCGHDLIYNFEEHSFGDGEVVRVPTETTPGETIFTCEVCGCKKVEETIISTSSMCPSCGEEGKVHDVCGFCQVRLCVGDHTTCVPTGKVIKVGFEGTYELYGIYKQYSFTPGIGGASVYFEWRFALTLNSDRTFVLVYSQRANDTHPYYELILYYGDYKVKGGGIVLSPGRAETIAGESYYVNTTVKTYATVYDDGSFSANLNDIRDICSTCGGQLSSGRHGICSYCNELKCNGSDHSHGGNICDGCGNTDVTGVHDRCEYCDGYVCDNRIHGTMGPCGTHAMCEDGDHNLCDYCWKYKCEGRHGVCSECGERECNGQVHEQCTYPECETQTYRCIGDHIHEGYYCEHVPYEDDGDCTTPVVCKICKFNIKESYYESHNLNVEYIKDETHHSIICDRDGCEYIDKKEQHTPDFDYSCINEIHCSVCDYLMKEKTAHNSDDDGYCSICSKEATKTLNMVLSSDGNSYIADATNIELSGDIVIPYSYNGKPISSLTGFKNQNMTSIYIPANVEIPDYCFENCTKLEKVFIEKGIIEFGDYAFYNCISLNEVTLPVSLTTISSYAFDNCSSLISIDIPKSVNVIEYGAFRNCSSLMNIELPNSITKIKNDTFAYCSSLRYINIPSSVTSIDIRAFIECINLYAIGIDVEAELTNIGANAFEGCSNLMSVTLNKKLLKISDDAFVNCSKLLTVNNYSNISLSQGTKYNGYVAARATTINIGKSNDSVVYDQNDYIIEEFSNGEKVIINYLGSNKYLNIPEVTKINQYAFTSKTIYAVVFPSTLTEIHTDSGLKNSSFYEICNLSSVDISSLNAKHICNSLKDSKVSNNNGLIVYDDGITKTLLGYIGSNEKVLIDNIDVIEEEVFLNNLIVKEIEITSDVTSIKNHVFQNCSNLEKVVINSTFVFGDNNYVNYIFKDCNKLKDLTIPLSNRYIYQLFNYETNIPQLEHLTILPTGDSQVLKQGMLAGCGNLKTLTLPFVGTQLNESYQVSFGTYFGTSEFDNTTPVKQTYVIYQSGTKYITNTYYLPKVLTKVVICSGPIYDSTFNNCESLFEIVLEGDAYYK